MKLLLSFLFVLLAGSYAYPQSDLLVLKQKNQIIQTWVSGSVINFQFSSKQWLQGVIKNIRNDSILMEQIDVRTVPNRFGFPTIDTAKLGVMKFHVNEIFGMPKRNYGSNIFTNGILLQLGSGAFMFLNIVNSLVRNEQVFSSLNLSRLGVAGSIFIVGSLLRTSHRTYIILGKKYRMETIRFSAGKQ